MELVLEHVSEVLGGAAVGADDSERAFEELGFDSLTGVELRNRLESAAGLMLPSTVIFDYPTPRALAGLLRSRAEGVEPITAELAYISGQAVEPRIRPMEADDDAYLSRALESVTKPSAAPRMPSAPLAIRVKTSPLLRSLLPARLAVGRAEKRAREIWEQDGEERAQALAAMERIVAGTARESELEDLARQHVIERNVDRALFWAHPWSAKIDALSALRLREALAERRGVLFSACHVGPFYRLHCAPAFEDRVTYLVPGPWFFDAPKPGYWGRRLARWHKGMRSRPVPARGSFRVIQALLEQGEAVFLFFDMPGPRRTRFLGKQADLAEGNAQLAVRADALVLPMRTRRAGHRVWVDVAKPLDPRQMTGVDELHRALAGVHERWILENPAAMEDPRDSGWGDGAGTDAWVAP
jgi:lauroyl/myristoyl acyltransferase/acyl carrier protein